MKILNHLVLACCICSTMALSAAPDSKSKAGIPAVHISISGELSSRDLSWYGTEEAAKTAEHVLLMQKENGGWGKNYRGYRRPLSPEAVAASMEMKIENDEATIDNKATYTEMVFLAQMYQATKNPIYKEAFVKALYFVLSLQYDNGGFKQFARDHGYYTHITYNDNAMMNIMQLLYAIQTDHPLFEGLLRKSDVHRVKMAVDKGIDCILNTQYLQHGVKTVWCAQHDEHTLLPAKARSYELPSLSGGESVGILSFLMTLPNPDRRIMEAVHAAMAWFDQNRIRDRRVAYYVNEEGRRDRKWVESSEGPDIWGRFCDLETNRAFVSDRDGIVKYDLSEIGYERRNGYAWYTSDPNRLFPMYEKWKERIGESTR